MSGGGPKISMAFGAKKLTTIRPLKPLNGTKRPHAALHDSDDEDDATGNHQEISHFDQAAGGAIHANGPPKTIASLVIPAKPNTDRLDYKRKGQTSTLPVENGVDIVIPKKQVALGLTVMEKRAEVSADDTAMEMEAPPAKTEDERALEALMGNKLSFVRSIPVVTEDEAYERDVDDAQDAPTLEEYLAIPVADFGAACLRGMGWKDTEVIDKGGPPSQALKPKIHERRPALLGVGAKPSSAVGVELGEWGKASMKKGHDKAVGYNPVMLKNKDTGEMLTEEELQARLVEQEKKPLEVSESAKSRDRKHKDDYRERDRHKFTDNDRNWSRRDREDDREKRRRHDYDGRKGRDSGWDNDQRDRKYRDRSSSANSRHRDDRKEKKSRHKSRSRSPSRDKYRSSKYDDERDRPTKNHSKYNETSNRSHKRDYESSLPRH